MDNYDVVFESERIKYVKLNENLIDDYLKMVNDPEVACRITHHPRPFSYEDEQAWIQSKLEEKAECYSMIDKETGKFIGSIEMKDIKDGRGEIGICITGDMQDQHFGTEAMKTMVDYGYNKLGLDTIDLNVFATNIRAVRCYQNAGFVQAGKGKELDDIHMIHRK